MIPIYHYTNQHLVSTKVQGYYYNLLDFHLTATWTSLRIALGDYRKSLHPGQRIRSAGPHFFRRSADGSRWTAHPDTWIG